MKANRQHDGADAAGDVDLGVFKPMKSGGPASPNEALVVVGNSDLPAMRVSTQREVYARSSGASKDDRIVCEQKFELIREGPFQRRRKIGLADHVIIDTT